MKIVFDGKSIEFNRSVEFRKILAEFGESESGKRKHGEIERAVKLILTAPAFQKVRNEINYFARSFNPKNGGTAAVEPFLSIEHHLIDAMDKSRQLNDYSELIERAKSDNHAYEALLAIAKDELKRPGAKNPMLIKWLAEKGAGIVQKPKGRARGETPQFKTRDMLIRLSIKYAMLLGFQKTTNSKKKPGTFEPATAGDVAVAVLDKLFAGIPGVIIPTAVNCEKIWYNSNDRNPGVLELTLEYEPDPKDMSETIKKLFLT
ncbi:MAG: hypothetical protein AAGA12_09785 [Pseudomonadota bacterium]